MRLSLFPDLQYCAHALTIGISRVKFVNLIDPCLDEVLKAYGLLFQLQNPKLGLKAKLKFATAGIIINYTSG